MLAALGAGVRARLVADGALAKVLDLRSPRAMVAVVRARAVELGSVVALAAQRRRPLLVLAAVQDPGNAGTLVRVAEATGCVGVVLSAGSVDLHNPKTVRSTAGAVFRVPVVEGVELDEVLAACADAGVPTIATVGRGGTTVEDAPLVGAMSLLIGAEAHGLDPEVVAACSHRVTVPMEGSVESLNAAVAGAVVLFDAARQRRAVERDSAGPTSPGGTSPGGTSAGAPSAMGQNGNPPAEPALRAEEGSAER